MATQEERLGTLENGFTQFKTETIKAYQDVAMELTMIKGLTQDSVERLKNIDRHFDSVELRLVEVKRDISSLDLRLISFEQRVDSRFEAQDKRFDGIDQRFEVQDQHQASFEQSINNRFEALDKKLDQVLSVVSKLTSGPQQET